MLYKWLDRLRDFGTITYSQKCWTLGRFYGYPTCCIKNFVNMSRLGLDCYSWMNEHFGPLEDPLRGRVKCVVCLKIGGDTHGEQVNSSIK
jgi:hypothetical protein